jgi:hypothetical protein
MFGEQPSVAINALVFRLPQILMMNLMPLLSWYCLQHPIEPQTCDKSMS